MSVMCSTPWKAMVIVTLLLHLSLPTEVCSSATSDRITRLPGQPPADFQQFAGYVTVDRKGERALFYYFVEAETEPSSKPLVLWFNGGPGCSSVGAGVFSENGPFRPTGNILVRNEYSWNTAANMLYVEMPAGVGFSYLRNMSQVMNDEITARDNLAFLRRWFVKFPMYKNRELFITGESYAGHYIPQLAELLIRANKQKKEFNLKGIALGNPRLEFNTDENSKAEFLWSHGLISDPAYRVLKSCNLSRLHSDNRGNVSSICSRVVTIVLREIISFVDPYDVTLDKCISPLQMQSLVLNPTQMTEKTDVCVLNKTEIYLKRTDVQTALHARLAAGVRKWELCSSGDQDAVIPLTGSRTLVHGLAARLGLNTTVPYRVWFAGGQVGGWTIVYGDMLSFATVRGASHQVPSTQPQRALVLFKAFLQGKPLPEHP